MNVVYFLKERTKFIRFYYDQCIVPFSTIKDQIENALPPFDDPPYSEDSEPAYLSDWEDADTGVQVVGLSCVSLLSDTLKLYFGSLQHRIIGFEFGDKKSEKKAFKKGFLAAHMSALGKILATDWSDCPVDLKVIEQVVLTRNRSQHGIDLTSFDVIHDQHTLGKHPRPFFLNEHEIWMSEEGTVVSSLLMPRVGVTRDALFGAIEQVEKLADWIDGRMAKAGEWRIRQG